jgi:phenylacetate-coenzyme A ligase PaaK-like adenylate-forming protein
MPELTPLEPWIARKIGAAGRLRAAELRAYQLHALRDTLAWARERSPFYRRHLAEAPTDLRSLDDLAALPFTTAAHIREQPLRFVCVSQGDIERVVTLDTSGTTGRPKRLYFTKDDQALTIDFFQVGMSTFTSDGDRVLILLPCARPGSVGDLLAIALERIGAEGIRHGPIQDAGATLSEMARAKATGLVGTPTQALALARYPEQPEGLTLGSALLTTDHVPDAIVAAVEGAWGCTVYNHYGMTEMGLGGGVECEARRGYHMREADLYVEIVDPHTGARVPDGQRGEVVFTTLTRWGMPLIRYRTGDASRFIAGACPCGTALKTLECVKGRLSDCVQVGDGHHLTMADLNEALFSLPELLDFSATLSGDGDVDQLFITATVIPGKREATRSAVKRQLSTLPAIDTAHQAGLLDIRVEAETTNWSTRAGSRLSKRIIVDHRNR